MIAGFADATIVVDAAEKGGSLVTAAMDFSYGREVFTFPGRVTDEYSKGCIRLAQMTKAALLQSAKDLIHALRWETTHNKPIQTTLAFHSSKPEHPIITLLAEKGAFQINQLATAMNLPIHQLSPMLFELEMDGHIKALPGGIYTLT